MNFYVNLIYLNLLFRNFLSDDHLVSFCFCSCLTGADKTSALLESGEEPLNCGFPVTKFGFLLGPEGLGADTTETVLLDFA